MFAFNGNSKWRMYSASHDENPPSPPFDTGGGGFHAKRGIFMRQRERAIQETRSDRGAGVWTDQDRSRDHDLYAAWV